jgi:hypothetical protein
MSTRNATRLTVVAAYLFGLLLLIYGPIVGRGFVADDFGWVKDTQPSFTQAAWNAFDHAYGFYRPLVNVSFAANYEVSGLSPRPYGLTNLALLFVCAGMVGWLGRAAGLSHAFSLVAAGLFAFNLHGVDMSVLWVSGRTGLFLTVFSLGAAIAFMKRHHVIAALLTLSAMFSKEEAVALPVMFVLWTLLESSSQQPVDRLREAFIRTRWLWVVGLTYAVLRLHSGAMWPSNAPPYYRFSAEPQLLLRNAREYADRACTLSAVALLVVFALVRSRPTLTRDNRVLLAQCGCWVICGFALTMFLPIRSSLYALFPSVGVSLAASIILFAWWPRVSLAHQRALVSAALSVPLLLIPVYRARADRWVSPARLSSVVTKQLATLSADPETHTIVVQDDRSTRANLANAFGPAVSDVATLYFSRPVTLKIESSRPANLSPGERLFVLEGPSGRLRAEVVD